MQSSIRLAVASADHISQPATDPLLVSQVRLTELALQVFLFRKDREDLQGPRADGHKQQNPSVPKCDCHTDACDHHLQVHRIAREAVRTALDDFSGRLPRVFALAGSAHEQNGPSAEQQHRAGEDQAADPVSARFGSCEPDVDRPNVLKAGAGQYREQRNRGRKHSYGRCVAPRPIVAARAHAYRRARFAFGARLDLAALFGLRLASPCGLPIDLLSAIASLVRRRAICGLTVMPSCSTRFANSYLPLAFNRLSMLSKRLPRQKPNSTRSSSARISSTGPFDR